MIYACAMTGHGKAEHCRANHSTAHNKHSVVWRTMTKHNMCSSQYRVISSMCSHRVAPHNNKNNNNTSHTTSVHILVRCSIPFQHMPQRSETYLRITHHSIPQQCSTPRYINELPALRNRGWPPPLEAGVVCVCVCVCCDGFSTVLLHCLLPAGGRSATSSTR
eukprot:845336-Pyramimonas_sp.AAC.2